jgi:thioredoxin 1
MFGNFIKTFGSILSLVILLSCNMGAKQADEKLSATAFEQTLKEQSDAQLIDVRTPEEFGQGHLEKAVNIDFKDEQFASKTGVLDKEKPVFVYCLSGGRSEAAVKQLKSLGFTQIYDLKGGIMSWKNDGLPVTESTVPEKADLFTDQDFNEMLKKNPAVLVDFYAEWCIPCKKMEPALKKLKEEYKGKVFVYRLNVDEAKALSSKMKIAGIPLFHLYKNGKLVKVAEGYQDEASLRSMITSI